MKKFLITILLAVSFITGRGFAPPVHIWHGIETMQLVHDEGVPESMVAWKVEIARRFPDAFVLFSHGGDNDKGVWTCYAEPGSKMREKPVQQVADELHAKFPGRKIVFIMCNPGHHRITTPDVYYALDSVWFDTDRSADATERARAVPEFVGNIFEFVTGDGR